MAWREILEQKQEIVLATSSKDSKPRAIVVVSLGFVDGKLLIGICLMKTTLENLKENNRISIVVKYGKEYYRIDGKAEIYSSGKYLDVAIEKSNPPLPKQALVVTIEEVFDLDKGEKIL